MLAKEIPVIAKYMTVRGAYIEPDIVASVVLREPRHFRSPLGQIAITAAAGMSQSGLVGVLKKQLSRVKGKT